MRIKQLVYSINCYLPVHYWPSNLLIYWTVLGTWTLIEERLTSEQMPGIHIWVHVFRKLPGRLVCLAKRNRHGSKSLNWTVLILGFVCTACCSVIATDDGKCGPLRWMGLHECPGILEACVVSRERWVSETRDGGLTSRELPPWVWRQSSCGSLDLLDYGWRWEELLPSRQCSAGCELAEARLLRLRGLVVP